MAAGTAGNKADKEKSDKERSDGKAAMAMLEDSVERLLVELDEARSGAAALASLSSETADPADTQELAIRIKSLEGENQDLRERLASGRGIAERLVAKIRFLEEKK